MKCGKTCEVYSRVCGYHRPTSNWNIGKSEEFKERAEYQEGKSLTNKLCSRSVQAIMEAKNESKRVSGTSC